MSECVNTGEHQLASWVFYKLQSSDLTFSSEQVDVWVQHYYYYTTAISLRASRNAAALLSTVPLTRLSHQGIVLHTCLSISLCVFHFPRSLSLSPTCLAGSHSFKGREWTSWRHAWSFFPSAFSSTASLAISLAFSKACLLACFDSLGGIEKVECWMTFCMFLLTVHLRIRFQTFMWKLVFHWTTLSEPIFGFVLQIHAREENVVKKW